MVEGLICGRDKEVRGTHVRVITKRRDVHMTRPVQNLYPNEVHAGPNRQVRDKEQSALQSGSFRCC